MRIMVGFQAAEPAGLEQDHNLSGNSAGEEEDDLEDYNYTLFDLPSENSYKDFILRYYPSTKTYKMMEPPMQPPYHTPTTKKISSPHAISSSGCGLEIIDKYLTKLFFWLGGKIGQHPTYYIIIPLFLALLLGTGMQRLIYVDDPEYLFSPVDGLGKFERELIEEEFPMNYSSRFNPSRFVRPGRFARLFITALDSGTLLRTQVWKEIMLLDQIMHNITIEYDESTYTYSSICAKWEEDCYENDVLELGDNGLMEKIEARNISLTYPIMLNPDTFKTYAFPFYFGGTEISNVSTILSVKALQLNYFVAVNSRKQDARGELWEAAVLDTLESLNRLGKLKHISVARFTVRTLATELERNTFSVFPYFSVTVVLMILFTVITCMMSDWVKSKPWLGLVGVLSSNLGSLAAFGLVCYCNVEFIGINMAAPFLMLGIGIDDTFVMLASWRRTSPHSPVPTRMAECYAEAAVSITITSITDMLSFWVGVLTPFPCVQIFSVYSGAAVIATYLWHIFFFGGAIALSGYHEEQNRHSLLWWKESIPKSKATHKSVWYRIFCSGGIDPADPYNPKDNPDHGIMVFFRDYWGAFLNITIVKMLVLAIFIGYLGVACWGTTKIQEGLERRRMVLYDSYAVEFFDREDMYFREYPYRIQVVVSGQLDYSHPETQKKIESLMSSLENSTFVRGKTELNLGSLYTESWLRSFLGYVERSKGLFDYNITTEDAFIETLFDSYLDPSSPFYDDVKLNENRTKIIASRFIIQTVNISNSNEERDMAMELRQIAASAGDLNVTVYHPFFIFFDQFLLIRYTSIQCILIAAIIMMVVSIVFIPNLLCSIWVAFSIVSIEIGVVGFMSLWGVNLDAISMINLIMCIGFSVDFSAHISYAYMSAKVNTPDERVRSCLYSLGLPIVQGAVSTVLGVLALLVAPSYIFITFFKVVFLVIVIAALHGLVLLPVLLSLFGPGSCSGAGLGGKGDDEDDMDHPDVLHFKINKKDQIVPYSFVVGNGKALDPKNNKSFQPVEKYSRRGSEFQYVTSFSDGQFINGVANGGRQNPGLLPPIPRVKSTLKNPTAALRNSLERDLGLGTSGGEDEGEGSGGSSESSLNKVKGQQGNNIGSGANNSCTNCQKSSATASSPKFHKDLYSNEGYLSDDEELDTHNKRSTSASPNKKLSKLKKSNSPPQIVNQNHRNRSLSVPNGTIPSIVYASPSIDQLASSNISSNNRRSRNHNNISTHYISEKSRIP